VGRAGRQGQQEGLRLPRDDDDWVEESYRIVAPNRLVAELDAR
jgi:hypothetical protein